MIHRRLNHYAEYYAVWAGLALFGLATDAAAVYFIHRLICKP